MSIHMSIHMLHVYTHVCTHICDHSRRQSGIFVGVAVAAVGKLGASYVDDLKKGIGFVWMAVCMLYGMLQERWYVCCSNCCFVWLHRP